MRNKIILLQVEDQFGNSVKLPSQERKALLVAMALHEKGRKALKKGDYSMALVMFLDADKEFRYGFLFIFCIVHWGNQHCHKTLIVLDKVMTKIR